LIRSSFWATFFDSWENEWPDQGENFKNICDFKRANADKVILLIGNHDFSYISGTRDGGCVSGHQNSKISEIRALITANLDIIDLAFECDGWVFSHAGFSKTAVSYMKEIMGDIYTVYPKADRNSFESKEEADAYFKELYKDVVEWDQNLFSIETLNKCWHERSHIPGDENFSNGFEEKLDWDGCFSGSGDEVSQFCLWIRPNSLIKEPYYPKQVVGHTEYCCMGDYEAITNKDKDIVVLCDSVNHDVFEVFDTQNPPTALTISDFNRKLKQFDKKIGNLKSLFGQLGADYKEFERIEKIKEVFPDNFDYVYDTYFKEWNV
jgi:hypothetical protein